MLPQKMTLHYVVTLIGGLRRLHSGKKSACHQLIDKFLAVSAQQ